LTLLTALHLTLAGGPAPPDGTVQFACDSVPFVPVPSPTALEGGQGEGPGTDGEAEDGAEARLLLRATPVGGARPALDGCLDDPIWGQADVAAAFVQFEPDRGETATELTEVRVLVDGGSIYVGARLHDTRPGEIRAPLSRTDDAIFSDWFEVVLDTNLDGRTAVGFAVNPRGVKRDYGVQDRFQEDPGWEAVWEAAVQLDSLGWSVELRIPLSQVGRPPLTDDGRQFGVNFLRRLGRSSEISSWAPMPGRTVDVVSSFGRLTGLDDVRRPVRLEVTPYAMSSAEYRSFSADEGLFPFGTAGIDLLVGLPGDFTLTSTANPDFGQVEADHAVVNTSGYRTFFPEKRPFFLEDRELFETSVGGALLFHSRRIGRGPLEPGHASDGPAGLPDASGILAATKISGRTRDWGAGLLHVATSVESVLTEDSLGIERYEPLGPRTHYGVARVERQSPDGLRFTTGTFTVAHRSALTDLPRFVSQAFVGAVKDRWRSQGGGHELTWAAGGSHVRGSPRVIETLQTAHGRYLQRPDASHLSFDPSRTSLTGFAGELGLARVDGPPWVWGALASAHSPGFEVNDVGFSREADVAQQTAYIGYDLTAPASWLRRRRLVLTQWSGWSFGAERLGTGASAELRLQLRSRWGLFLYHEVNLDGLSTDLLRGGPAIFVPGNYRTRFTLNSDPRRVLYVRLDGSRFVEQQSGGVSENLRLQVDVQPAPRLMMSVQAQATYRRDAIDYVSNRAGPERVHRIFGRISQRVVSIVGRSDFAFSPNLSLGLYAQPYFADRRVGDLMEVVDARATSPSQRFRPLGPSEARRDPALGRVLVDVTGDGTSDFSFPDPDFHFMQWSSNVVLRWEFRPASTLFVVWRRDALERRPGPFDDPSGLVSNLFWTGGNPVPGRDALVVKITFRLGT
jgi:hypothetical protein